MRGVVFASWTVAIAGVVFAQSVVHLAMVLGAERTGTVLDLDRSNGLPDVVSTVVLGVGAAGAARLASLEPRPRPRVVPGVLAGLLAVLTLADLLHDGAHPSRETGPLVIVLIVCAVALLAVVAVGGSVRVRLTVATGVLLLGCSFFISGLDKLDRWFQRERGDPVAEYQIVAKEGLELLGWSLVALALWDEAFSRRRGLVAVTTARASRAPAASKRRVA